MNAHVRRSPMMLITASLLAVTVVLSMALNVEQSMTIKSYRETVNKTAEVNEVVRALVPGVGETDAADIAKLIRPVNAQDLDCMAQNIYFESRAEPLAGQIAVAQVVMNRYNDPAYPHNVCAIIKQKDQGVCQFSWVCEPNHVVQRNSREWATSMFVAKNVLAIDRTLQIDITEGATYFHANYVKPSWAKTKKLVAVIDNHLFYK